MLPGENAVRGELVALVHRSLHPAWTMTVSAPGLENENVAYFGLHLSNGAVINNKIGRASCRERVQLPVVGESGKTKDEGTVMVTNKRSTFDDVVLNRGGNTDCRPPT